MNLAVLAPLLYPGAIVATLFSLWRPRLGIYYLVLVLPLQTLRYQIQSYPLGGSVIDIVLLGVVIGTLLQRNDRLFAALPMKGVLLFSFLYWYISLWHGSFFLGLPWPTSVDDLRFSFWKSYVELGLLCFIAFAAIRSKEQIRTVLILMCIAALAISFDFFQVTNSQDLSHFSDSVRYAGTMGYAGVNGLAAFEAMFGLFLAGMLSTKLASGLRSLVFVTLISCGYCLLFAFSRGAYIAFAVGLVSIAMLQKRFVMLFVLAGLLGGGLLLPSSVGERISGTYVQSANSSDQTLESSAQDRVIIWQDAFQLFKEYPLRGTGFQTYSFMHRSLGFGDTHNFYMKVLVEEGIIGLIIFLVILGSMFKKGYLVFRNKNDAFLSAVGLGFLGCMVAAAIVNVFGDRWTYLQVDSYLWILLAIVCRASLIATSPTERESEERAQEPAASHIRSGHRIPPLHPLPS